MLESQTHVQWLCCLLSAVLMKSFHGRTQSRIKVILPPDRQTSREQGEILYLEFPLSRHDFCVDTRQIDASVVAGLQVRLHNFAPHSCSRTGRAVVRPLRAWEAIGRPAQRPLAGCIQQCVLLQSAKRVSFRVKAKLY